VCQHGHWPDCALKFAARLNHVFSISYAKFRSSPRGGVSIALFRTVVFHAASARGVGPFRADVVH
jgi:hypothetical protein